MPTETETGTQWVQDILVDPIRMAGQQIGEQLGSIILPLLGVLLIVLPIGYFVAKLVESLVVKVLQTLAVDKVADQVQLSTMLSKGGIRQKLSELVGMIVYWLIMLAVVMIAFNALQLTVAAELFQTVVAYLPNVRVVVALGKIAFDVWWRVMATRGVVVKPRPPFGHGEVYKPKGGPVVIASYHPSRQNTNTGKLTPQMMSSVFSKAAKLLSANPKSRIPNP